jgi:hypothetical protein
MSAAWLSFAGIVITFLTSVVGWLSTHRKVNAVKTDVEVVHGLVNEQHDILVARKDQLQSALVAADVPVPPKPKRRGSGGHL